MSSKANIVSRYKKGPSRDTVKPTPAQGPMPSAKGKDGLKKPKACEKEGSY